ncbi:MAG TPA: flagellar basal body rod protein FlgG, partial [Acidimicrobiaceae bacterium]|nr:flagellar basal body rod protein FlgG [Acidimicrobiaceae bacterium]
MIRSMFSAVSGLRAHRTMLDVVGNNIATSST